jgi:hypothetical protein
MSSFELGRGGAVFELAAAAALDMFAVFRWERERTGGVEVDVVCQRG